MGTKVEVRASIGYNSPRFQQQKYCYSHLFLLVSTLLLLHSLSPTTQHIHTIHVVDAYYWSKKSTRRPQPTPQQRRQRQQRQQRQRQQKEESSTNIHNSQGGSRDGPSNNEQLRAKYASLPHTIFSPQGRLFNVEKAALSSSDETDVSSNLVFAFQFGGDSISDGDGAGDGDGNNVNSNSILVISTGSSSPYLHNLPHEDDGAGTTKDDSLGNENETMDTKQQNSKDKPQKVEPLWNHDVYTIHHPEDQLSSSSNHHKMTKITPSHPLSILSPNLIIGTGGNAIDSIVLHTKILDIFLSLSKSMDGMNATHRINGKDGLKSSLLARKIADMLQVPTQDVSANSGRILSSSALVIGMNEVMSLSTASDTAVAAASCNRNEHKIWRIDPTGQFWSCQGAAVGRGAGLVEGSMLRSVKRWKQKQQHDDDDDDNKNSNENKKDGDGNMNNNDDGKDINNDLDTLLQSISNEDVEQCFQNMTFDEAIKFACHCICKIHKISNSFDIERVAIQGMLLPSTSSKPEMIHPGIIRECLNTMIHHSNQSILRM